MQNKKFFNELSEYYDSMIRFNDSLQKKKELLKNLIGSAKTAADLGCGTGLDSIALAQLGLDVIAFDPSDKMIGKAHLNAADQNAAIGFYDYPIIDIPQSFNEKFDLVISLGNTLANIEPGKIELSLKKTVSLMKPGARLLVQILNYKLIKNSNERIINITGNNDWVYVRFYDIFDDYFNFNVIQFSKQNYKNRFMLSTKIYPYTGEELTGIFGKAKLKEIDIFGSLKMEKYNEHISKDLIITAIK
ncbi:MAG: class I SAM-dependent methyltransferase [Melioribacteraceae bacterium]|nr:class I SAM-dependent methyltransferase [Melioribacteraceae bacterium]